MWMLVGNTAVLMSRLAISLNSWWSTCASFWEVVFRCSWKSRA